MASVKHSSRATQRQIDLSTAVCQERLLATHVRHVLALVDLVSDELPFDDALDIYVRILRLTPEQARNIGSRALAELGRRTTLPDARVLNLEDAAEDEPEERPKPRRSQVVFSRLRRRIRGRVHDELRYRIDLAAARAEDAVFDTHIDNALIFAKALADGGADAPEAVEVYLDTMMLPEGMGDVIFNRALRMIADEALPPVPTLEPARGAHNLGTGAVGAPAAQHRA